MKAFLTDKFCVEIIDDHIFIQILYGSFTTFWNDEHFTKSFAQNDLTNWNGLCSTNECGEVGGWSMVIITIPKSQEPSFTLKLLTTSWHRCQWFKVECMEIFSTIRTLTLLELLEELNWMLWVSKETQEKVFCSHLKELHKAVGLLDTLGMGRGTASDRMKLGPLSIARTTQTWIKGKVHDRHDKVLIIYLFIPVSPKDEHSPHFDIYRVENHTVQGPML